MLDRLRVLPPLASCQAPAKPKKAAPPKKKTRNLIKIEATKANTESGGSGGGTGGAEYGSGGGAGAGGGQTISPISRLIQIQQAKREKEPVYTLTAEKGLPRRREFIMQVGTAPSE